MELFKAAVALCLSPLVITLLLQLIGWLALWRKRNKTGLAFLAAGTLVLLIGSLDGLTVNARRAREHIHAPFDVSQLAKKEASVVMVLGTGFNPDSELPANSRVSSVFLTRLVEATRIVRARPDCELVVSIAGDADNAAKTRFLDEIAGTLQLPRERITLQSDAKSTGDEAAFAAERFSSQDIILVTTAAHMPRAISTFESHKLRVAAAPAGFNFSRPDYDSEQSVMQWIPSADGLMGTHAWLYESVASLWQAVSK